MSVYLFFLQQAHTRCHQTDPHTAAEKVGFKKTGRQQSDAQPGQPDPKQLIPSAHWQHLPEKFMHHMPGLAYKNRAEASFRPSIIYFITAMHASSTAEMMGIQTCLP